MHAIETSQSNHNFGPPRGQEERIGDLPCEFRDTDVGTFIYSTWVPNEHERAAIAGGQNIELGVGWCGVFPPVSLGVTPAGMTDAKSEHDEAD